MHLLLRGEDILTGCIFVKVRISACSVTSFSSFSQDRRQKADQAVAAFAEKYHKIYPTAIHFYISFIYPPGVMGGLEMGSTAFLQLGSAALNPARDCSMIHSNPSFSHHFFQISGASQAAISAPLSPGQRFAITEESTSRTIIRQSRSPDNSRGSIGDRASPCPPHIGGDPTRTDGIHQHVCSRKFSR